MYVLTYQFKRPNDNLSGPGYSWERRVKTFPSREKLVRGILYTLNDGWYGPDDFRNLRIYEAYPSPEETEIFSEAAKEAAA